mmetsp:Transcript_58278/g.161126  ORF Transcript_58278/g.161126 Transcript_58278/m.161126 type:complete len:643 (-) Transcript_58278:55-1983(-)
MAEVPFLNHVPHYDVHGHQHHRQPYKDKSQLLSEDIRHPKWLDPAPAIRSRSELQQARKRGRVPDLSYDFDGDGSVGQLDFFIGRSFDADNDGKLTDTERTRAREALDKGFMDKHMRVMQDSGRLVQRAGVILDGDNTSRAAGLMYPPHYNSHVVPEVATKTALQLSRRADLKAAGSALGERYAAENAPVMEPQPPNAQTEPRKCSIGSMRERAEADHQESRTRAGLLTMGTPINPERDTKELSLQRVEAPHFKTRSQLLETRKELTRRECEELRLKGDEVCVPNSVRQLERELREFEFRRPVGDPMTQTKLQDQRRRDKLEYDMRNFQAEQPRQYPRYADRPEVPFWSSASVGLAAEAGREPPRAVARTASEPVLKVTEVPFGDKEPRRDVHVLGAANASAGKPAGGVAPQMGSHTVRRWTTDMLERGQGRNKPRLFDNIQPMRIGPLDLMPLEITSSMECIRNAAKNGREEERQRAAENPLRSVLYNENSQIQPSVGVLSIANSRMGSKIGAGSQRDLSGAEGSGKVAHGSTAPPRKSVVTSMANDTALRTTSVITTVIADKPREPRFFGSLTRDLSQSGTVPGVRCGGFQRFEPPPKQSRGAPQQRARSGRGELSKDRERGEASPATPGPAPAPVAQPV